MNTGNLRKHLTAWCRSVRFLTVPNGPDHLTPPQAAKRFGKDPSTVLAWIKSGKLAAIKLPSGRYVVEAAEVDRILGRAS